MFCTSYFIGNKVVVDEKEIINNLHIYNFYKVLGFLSAKNTFVFTDNVSICCNQLFIVTLTSIQSLLVEVKKRLKLPWF